MKRDYETILQLRVNVHIVTITILVLAVLLSNLHFVLPFFGESSPPVSSQQIDEMKQQLADAEKTKAELEFDRVRIQDASNIILAIQEFYFQKNSLPTSLADLKGEGFVDPTMNLNDPETNQPYFYQNRTNDFVLCVWLSDAVKGMNTDSCPTPEVSALSSPAPSSSALPSSSPSATVSPTPSTASSIGQTILGALKIIGNVDYVNVRKAPSTSSPIVSRTKPGDMLEFYKIQGNWFQVVVQGIQGWVSGNYVKTVSP